MFLMCMMAPIASGQSISKEYIYLDSRLIAVENGTASTPVLSIASPTSADSYQASSNSISLAGNVTAAVNHVSWTNDRNGSGTCNLSGLSWNCGSITVASGSTAFTVTAFDSSNIVLAADSLTVLYSVNDTIPPTIAMTFPSSSPYNTSSVAITLTGSSSDNVGISKVTWKVSRSGMSDVTGSCGGPYASFQCQNIALVSGNNVFTVTAYDYSNNSVSANFTVNYTIPGSAPPTPYITTIWIESNTAHVGVCSGNYTPAKVVIERNPGYYGISPYEITFPTIIGQVPGPGCIAWDMLDTFPGTIYTFRARLKNSSGTYGAWSNPFVIGCPATLSASNINMPAAGGNGTVDVSCSANCSWTAMTAHSWIAVTGGRNGTGNGTVSFSIAANSGQARTGTISIAQQTFTVNQAGSLSNPVPTLTNLSPNLATTGGQAFTLTVTGTNFVFGSVVRWNGNSRTTAFVSAIQLTASITAADIATAGSATVTVFNPAPGGGVSGSQSFAVNNPAPALTSISPNSAAAGGQAFTLTVTGTNFVSGSIVRWNGNSRTTTFVSTTQLTASITAADIATAGSATVTVFNPAPGGGASGSQTFAVNNPAPTLTSISPNSATAGGQAFTLTVTGTNFVSGSIVRWNGNNRTTTYVSTTQLTASITAADVAAAGSATVTIFNAAPGGGASGSQTLVVNNPTPALANISPNSATAGGQAFTLTVTGTNFVSGSIVRWNGNNRTTTFVSATQLTASITAADIANVGSATVTAFNPTPGGGTSGSLTFAIISANPVPTVASLNPNSAIAGGAPFTLTITGSNFVSGSTVRWNGNSRTTTYVSATQLTAAITALDIATAGSANITIFNPAPGGGASGTQTFTINNPVPTLSSVSPNSASAGGQAFSLTVTGTNFVSGSIVQWNGVNRTTIYNSSTQLSANILATDIAARGSATVTVWNPGPAGGASNGLSFNISDAQPTSMTYSANSGFAGIDSYIVTVGNGGSMMIDILYDFTPWLAPTSSFPIATGQTYYGQTETVGPLNGSGQMTRSLSQNAAPGSYKINAIKNHNASAWVYITSFYYTIRPPRPTAFSIDPCSGYPISVSGGNMQNQSMTLSGAILVWPDQAFPFDAPIVLNANGTGYAYASDGPYLRYITSVRNTLDLGWDSSLSVGAQTCF
jgi:hypothetical protein